MTTGINKEYDVTFDRFIHYDKFFNAFYVQIKTLDEEADVLEKTTKETINDIKKLIQEITNQETCGDLQSNTQKSISERIRKITTLKQNPINARLQNITTEFHLLGTKLLRSFHFPEGSTPINQHPCPTRMEQLWELITTLRPHVERVTSFEKVLNQRFSIFTPEKNTLSESMKIRKDLIENIEKIRSIVLKILEETDTLTNHPPQDRLASAILSNRQTGTISSNTSLSPQAAPFIPSSSSSSRELHRYSIWNGLADRVITQGGLTIIIPMSITTTTKPVPIHNSPNWLIEL